ncbi:uncharacterized protein [Aegilops tauschii subsp. strangulata]|uniref:uncharacterized protein n=1 Tax=Aegilops tauschii subsp. strangulata TaxID=200361 RepID=UPI003CC87711
MLLLTLQVTSRKLRHSLQGHLIKVVSAYPLEKVLCSPNATGQVAKWNIELQAFQLELCTTRVIKRAALADFMAKCMDTHDGEPRHDQPLLLGDEAPDGWVMHFDGAFSRQGAGAGAMLVSPTKDKLYYAVQLCFQCGEKVSNNIAEYEGLIISLKAAAALGVKRLTIKGNSPLLVSFFNKEYKPKDEHMATYLEEVRKMEKRFLGLELQHIPRDANREADDIELPPAPPIGTPACGTTSGAHLLLALEPQAGSLIEELKAYLLHSTLQEKDDDAKRVAREATAYCL